MALDERRLVVLGLALAVLSAALGLVLAGCGGSKSPSVASLAPTTSAERGETSTEGPSPAALAACLTAHGVSAVVGSNTGARGERTINLPGVVVIGGTDPRSPQLQSAMQACRKFLPGGGPPALTPSQRAAQAKALARFAACMRSHGVSDFPDPTGQGMFAPGSLPTAADLNAPLFQSAYKVCAPLLASTRVRF